MSKKRFFACSGIFGACVGLAVLVLALLPSGPGVTYANFKRVQVGMTKAEVTAIFGVPPGLMAPNGKSMIGLYYLCSISGRPASVDRQVWSGNDGGAMLEFDESDRVAITQWFSAHESFFDRVRAWLRI